MPTKEYNNLDLRLLWKTLEETKVKKIKFPYKWESKEWK